jgi:hypothetical protein
MHGRLLILVAIAGLALVLSGCGSGNTHRYVLTSSDPTAAGVYVTIDSPVEIPKSELERNGAELVDHAVGPKMCKETETINGRKGRWAGLNGKKVTITLTGTNPLLGIVCTALKDPDGFARSLGGPAK